MIRLVALFAMAALPAMAQTVRVTSGEHEGFTRLVLQLPEAETWRLGRRDDGYELRLGAARRFDLSQVFRPIGRDRLAAIWADPASGALRLGVGCACYAVPFEYRPGVLVIDLRNGPPPRGLAYEQGFDGIPMPPLTERPRLRPQPRPVRPAAPAQGPAGYDWLTISRTEERPAQPPRAVPPRLTGRRPPGDMPALARAAETGSLRQALLQQLSRGAAQGAVEMALPEGVARNAAADLSTRQIRIDPAPGRLDSRPTAPLTAKGDPCLTPDRLAVQDWLSDAPIAVQFGPARAGLVGEFDRSDPEAVATAARFLLSLGFGAETRALLDAMPGQNADAPVWRSMSFILDGEPDPSPVFAGLAACETPAALWALLETDPPGRGEPIATGAALQAFSALPPHLRRHLGPRLVEVLLAVGKDEAAATVQAAVLRAPQAGDGGPDAAAATISADLALARGAPAEAERQIAPLADQPGPDRAEALATWVAARVAQRLPVPAPDVTAIEALLRERRGGPDADRLLAALVLARAGSGDFDGAFAALPEAAGTAPQLWMLLAETGADGALITHAIARGPTPAASPVSRRIAERLITLGLGKEAEPWLAMLAPPDPLLSAQARLAEADGRGALRLLAGQPGAEADGLRARALTLLGEDLAAAEIYARDGREADRQAAEVRARDWGVIAESGTADWRAAAALLAPPDATATGPAGGALTRARALAEQSASDRDVLTALLAQTGAGRSSAGSQ